MKVITDIGKEFYEELDPHQTYVLDFQIRSVLHQIAVEQILKPCLLQIPLDVFLRYPDDFRFENCDRREIIASDIRNYIMDKEGI